MTPKHKAKNLIDKYVSIMHCLSNQTGFTINEHAVNCAIILIDEMIIQNGNYYLENKESKIDYSYYCKINGELFDIKKELLLIQSKHHNTKIASFNQIKKRSILS